MRIAMISTPFIPVPPPRYGGTELIVAELCLGLERLGHEVRLYTVGGEGPVAQTRALYRRPVWPPDPYHELNHSAWAIADLLADDESVDVIHAHCPTAVPLARFARLPFVYTIHHDRSESLAALYGSVRGVHYACISERQLELHPELRGRTSVVHHGVDPDRYPLGTGGAPAVFLGRLSAEKGPDVAIDVARRAGVALRVAGQPHTDDQRWFAAVLEPLLRGPDVEWLGELDHRRKIELLQKARATLFPIDWEEPFGLVLIESMLCGTPVLAYGRGSVPEIVDQGVTGWVCADAREMTARLRALDDGFDRVRCRARAVERFGRNRMVEGYLRAYGRAIEFADMVAARRAESALRIEEPPELA